MYCCSRKYRNMKRLILLYAFLCPVLLMGQDGVSKADFTISDTIRANILLEEANSFLKKRALNLALKKAELAKGIYELVLGAGAEEVAECWHLMGELFFLKGYAEGAKVVLEKALTIRLNTLGAYDPKVAISYNYLGNVYQNLGDYEKAIHFHEKSLDVNLSIYGEQHPNVATLYNNLGYFYEKQSQYERAVDLYEKALSVGLIVYGASHPTTAIFFSNIGISYGVQGKYEKAEEYFEKALEVRLLVHGGNHPDVAISYRNLGDISLGDGEYEKAMDFYEKALKIKLSLNKEKHFYVSPVKTNIKDIGGIASSSARIIVNDGNGITMWLFSMKIPLPLPFFNRGVRLDFSINSRIIYINPSQYKGVQILNEETLIIEQPAYQEHHHYDSLNMIIESQGQYEKAIVSREKKLEIQEPAYQENDPVTSMSYRNLGHANIHQGKHEQAIKFYEKALQIDLAIFNGNHAQVAISCSNLGHANLDAGQYDKAIECYKKALEIVLSVYEDNHPQVAISYSNLGNASIHRGKYDEAIEFYSKALKVRQLFYGGNHSAVANSYNNLGNVYAIQGKYERAIGLYKKALCALNFINSDDLNEVNSSLDLATTFMGLGIACYNQYLTSKNFVALSSARYYYQKSIRAYASHAKKINSTRKSLMAKATFDINNLAIATNHLLYEITDSIHYLHEAFCYAENTKAHYLLKSIQESEALSFSGISNSLLEQEHDIRAEITFHEKQRQQKFDEGLSDSDSTVLTISSKLFDLRQEYENLKATFEKKYPDYYRLKYDLSTVSVAEIQQDLIDTTETLLEYFVGDSSIYIYTINKNDFQFHEIKKDFPLEQWIKDFRLSNDDKKTTRDIAVRNYHETARELYQKLIAPVAEQLKEKVIIIPDGLLGYLPFEALLVEPVEDPLNWKDHHYFIKDKQISYCYSATLLKEMKEKQLKQKAAKGVLAFAPFYYDKQSTSINEYLSYADSASRATLDTLRHSGEEIYGIQKIAGGDVFFRKEATETQFTRLARDYKFIHLATHGKANDKVGDYSFLVFTEQKDGIENELLYVRDLFNLQLNAEMVVLSACETGIGELQKGEGIISLARGFTYAGTKSIITSLWRVNDASTKELMVGFYKHLKAGETKDKALQLAKLDYLKTATHGKAHPYYWSGFIGIGDMRGIVF